MPAWKFWTKNQQQEKPCSPRPLWFCRHMSRRSRESAPEFVSVCECVWVAQKVGRLSFYEHLRALLIYLQKHKRAHQRHFLMPNNYGCRTRQQIWRYLIAKISIIGFGNEPTWPSRFNTILRSKLIGYKQLFLQERYTEAINEKYNIVFSCASHVRRICCVWYLITAYF